MEALTGRDANLTGVVRRPSVCGHDGGGETFEGLVDQKDRLRRKQPDLPRPFRTPLVPLVPILGIVWNFAMMYSLGIENWLRLIVWLAIGQAIYFGYSRHHSHLGNPVVARK